MILVLILSIVLAVPGSEPRTLAATPTNGSIAVDGRLDEADWQTAEIATDFRQFGPDEGAPATQRTEVRVLYGPTAIYVGAMLYDDEPDRIRRTLTRRDELGKTDRFIVSFDGYGDGRSAYFFLVTAAGVQLDGVRNGNNQDTSWDAVWRSAARITPEGWIAELAIPYSMLRFPQAEEQTWGAQFQRYIDRNSELDTWEPLTRATQNTGFVGGRLTGLRGLAPRRAVQVRPYTLSRIRAFEDTDAPGTTDTDLGADVGADVKLGLTSDLILDATVNPDFGQVEADPAVLNLSTFEIFFDERRPFFLEGVDVFDYTIDSGRDGRLLYTRRIGATDPIIAASKLTGRTDGGLAIGALGALTGDDFEPARFYGVGRAKREFGERNAVGTGITYFDGPEEAGRRRAVAGGADFVLRLAENTYNWDGTLTLSHRALPDETRTGFGLYTGFDKIRGTTTWGSGVRVYSDDFRVSDVGRINEVDMVRALGGAQIFLNGAQPVGPFRRVQLGLFGNQTWRYSDGANRGLGIDWNVFAETMGFNEVSLRGSFSRLGGLDVRETRGLGPIRNRRLAGVTGSYETDSRRRLVAETELGIEVQEGGGFGWSTELEIEWNASDRLDLAVEVEYAERDRFTAWAANEFFRRTDEGFFIGDTPNTPTPDGVLGFGGSELAPLFDGVAPYDGEPDTFFLPVFGERDTREVDVSLRTNVVFRPNLSLQLYSQLFAARGRFRDFQLLADADDLRPFEAYPKRRDLSLQALIANAVLRWEYRPGSTLFIVWSHNRSDNIDAVRLADDPTAPPFGTTTFDQLGDTFGLYPENVVLVKLSYLILR